jgi:hypothetical protein
MTTMVASHHVDLWQRRTQPAFHMPNMNLAGLMSPYDAPRTVTNPPVSRSYHQTASSMDMSMPLFSANGLTSSVPYQPGAFAFDSVPVNPYNMQHAYPMGYVADVPQNVSYARSSLPQQMSAGQEVHNAYNLDRHMSKSVTSSPLHSTSTYHNSTFGAELERSHSEPVDSSGVNFATDVDTLMKAIQAKQPESPQPPPASKVRRKQATSKYFSLTSTQVEESKAGQKPRKRYQCNMPGCNKSFYQKTHLEIHVRAHTGAKPFVGCFPVSTACAFAKRNQVCKAPSCGQRFSQLGNLKVSRLMHCQAHPLTILDT